jgi:hypothetical protein
MSDLIFSVGIGVAFLVLLLLWAQRSARAPLSRRESFRAEEALGAFQLGLPTRTLAERIFAQEDWDYVAQQAPPEVRRAFLRERKTLALAWLRQTRLHVGILMRFHRRAVRGNARLSPAMEAGLTAHYLVFLMLYQVLCGLVWLRGPFWVQGMVGYAGGVAQEMSYLCGRLLASLDPESLGRVATAWPRGPEGS